MKHTEKVRNMQDNLIEKQGSQMKNKNKMRQCRKTNGKTRETNGRQGKLRKIAKTRKEEETKENERKPLQTETQKRRVPR